MKINCNGELLSTALSHVVKAVASKSTIATLEGVLIKTAENKIILSGYDLEMGITTTIEAHVERDGETVINAKLFYDVIRKISNQQIPINIELHENSIIEITSGQTKFNITTMSPKDYPELPKIDEVNTIEIAQWTLKNAINKTLFATATTNTTSMPLTGELFRIDENQLTMVAVDGYRMAIFKHYEQRSTESKELIIPNKTLSEIARMLKDEEEELTDKGDIKPVLISSNSNHVYFKINNFSIYSRLLNQPFFNYSKVIPEILTSTVKVSTHQLIDAIERVSLIITDKIKNPIKCIFRSNNLEIYCNTTLGSVVDNIEINLEGEEIELGFNTKYLIEALRAANCSQVKIEIYGKNSGIKVLPLEGDEFMFLILPVILKGDE